MHIHMITYIIHRWTLFQMACLDHKGKSQMIDAENQSSKLSILIQSKKTESRRICTVYVLGK